MVNWAAESGWKVGLEGWTELELREGELEVLKTDLLGRTQVDDWWNAGCKY